MRTECYGVTGATARTDIAAYVTGASVRIGKYYKPHTGVSRHMRRCAARNAAADKRRMPTNQDGDKGKVHTAKPMLRKIERMIRSQWKKKIMSDEGRYAERFVVLRMNVCSGQVTYHHTSFYIYINAIPPSIRHPISLPKIDNLR